MSLDWIKHHFKAIFFDFDGTLVNSMPAHNQAWITTLLNYGVSITEDELFQLAGIPNLKTAQILYDRHHLTVPPEVIVQQKEQMADLNLKNVKPHDDVLKVAQYFYKQLPLAVVSGSRRAHFVKTLDDLQISYLFHFFVGSEDTPIGKPDPAPYLLAAQHFSVQTKDCLVFEDGPLGIQSATDAGMTALWVRHGQILWPKDI